MVCACEFECVQCFFLVDQEEDCCEDVDAGVCLMTPKNPSLITISAMSEHRVLSLVVLKLLDLGRSGISGLPH